MIRVPKRVEHDFRGNPCYKVESPTHQNGGSLAKKRRHQQKIGLLLKSFSSIFASPNVHLEKLLPIKKRLANDIWSSIWRFAVWFTAVGIPHSFFSISYGFNVAFLGWALPFPYSISFSSLHFPIIPFPAPFACVELEGWRPPNFVYDLTGVSEAT